MNKKLIAVAVAGALGAPGLALAQASTVQIGGSFNMLYYSHEPNNPNTAKRGDILEQSEPELKIQGEEALGGGLSAWFQCASTFDVAGSAANGLCGRNSALGLKGKFGNVFTGNWDMPQKLVINEVRGFFSGTNALWGGTQNLLNGGSSSGVGNPQQLTSVVVSSIGAAATTTTTMSNNAAQFYRRQANSWSYWSPVWSGFQLQGAYSATNETTALPTYNPLKPRLYSAALHYTNGPLWLGVGYERHQDYNPWNSLVPSPTVSNGATTYAGGTDDNWVIGARYTFAGKVKLSGMYSKSNYDVTNSTDAAVDGWAVFVDWAIAGPHNLRGQYAQVQDISGTATTASGAFSAPVSGGVASNATGATLWGINYGYKFSKRTEGILSYQRLNNDSNARFSLGKETPTFGASQTSFGVGMKHSF